MEHKMQRIVVLVAGIFLLASSVSADTYRWKDKDGKTHYGAAVPAEFADQPYDVLNSAGMVIDHIEDTREPLEVRAERIVKERAPLISDSERQLQSDRLLVIQYSSEEAILKALELEIAQLGYDSKIIHQSFDSTKVAIKDHVRVAADQQRSGKPIVKKQQQGIDKLYRRLDRDTKRIAALDNREARIRARFQSDLDRYKMLTAVDKASEEEPENDSNQMDQG